jgi:hypothetical protein
VHESCLQKWRNENADNKKYVQCEICQAEYVILQVFPRETFEMRSRVECFFNEGDCPLFCNYSVYLFAISLVIAVIDSNDGQVSLYILNGGGNTTGQLIEDINDTENLYWIVYYMSYVSYIFGQLFFMRLALGVWFNVHRKRAYLKNTLCKLSILFILGWGYFYNYVIFYKIMHRMDIYVVASMTSIPINFLIMKCATLVNDNTINKINNTNRETIMSVIYNPLIEIREVVE